jgi:hypothetical protein
MVKIVDPNCKKVSQSKLRQCNVGCIEYLVRLIISRESWCIKQNFIFIIEINFFDARENTQKIVFGSTITFIFFSLLCQGKFFALSIALLIDVLMLIFANNF